MGRNGKGTRVRACHRRVEERNDSWHNARMSAALMRESRVKRLLPLAVAQGWSVRRFAGEAKIGYASASAALRVVAQRPETASDSEMASLCVESAGEIRQAVGRAVKSLVDSVQAQVTACAGSLDSSAVERLARAMESALRVADSLDGLGHVRAMETALMRSAGTELLERAREEVMQMEDGLVVGSVEWYMKQNNWGPEGSEAAESGM